MAPTRRTSCVHLAYIPRPDRARAGAAAAHTDPKTSLEQSNLPPARPGPGFSEREEAEGQAVEDALLAEVDRIEREEG